MQKARILARLAQGPATGEQLQTECKAPDPSALIFELRNEGHNITTNRLHRINRDGTVNHVGLYVLRAKNNRQAMLIRTAMPRDTGARLLNLQRIASPSENPTPCAAPSDADVKTFAQQVSTQERKP